MKTIRPAALALSLFASLPALAADFTLRSADISGGGALGNAQVLKGFGCDGGNLSPQLSWSDPPEGTKSFVLTVYDPDAPTGSGWWHWVVFDIPATARALDAAAGSVGTLPAGSIQSRTNFGRPGYGGACPPPGVKPHRYVFTLTALKIEKLGLDTEASAALVGFMTNANRIGVATLTATYGR